VLAPGAYLVFDETQFNPIPGASGGFSLNASGEGVFLFSGDGRNLTGYSHGFAFGAADPGVSFGRHLNSAGEEQFPAQRNVTFGRTNAGPRVGPIVFTEIHYHPEPGSDEFVELQNISDTAVSLFHPDAAAGPWRINGLGYTLPPGVTLVPGQYLVLSGLEPALFRARHNLSTVVIVLGPFPGVLQDSGEKLELQRPELFGTNGPAFVTVETVRYNDKAPWPPAADGSGPSLQRLVPNSYADDPTNWVAAMPTPGRPFSGGTPPVVLTSPGDTNVVVFQSIALTVSATGTAPLGYQWRFNGTPIPTATNVTLPLTNVQPTQAGSYSVAVYNEAGSTVSAPAYLTVLTPPSIIQQPRPQSAQPGGSVAFNIVATGAPPLQFHWLFNGNLIQDATNNVLVLTNVQPADDGLYAAIVTSGLGSLTSDAARLAVLVAPVITQAPWGQAVVPGGSVTLSVTVTNTATLPLGYRWRRGPISLAFFVVNERTSTFLLNNVQSSGGYNVLVTNLASPNGVLSAVATITLLDDVDHDGLPDLWEIAYGLNPTNASDRYLDADGDGLTNAEEYLAGTDPANALSYLKIDQSTATANGVALEFVAVSNRTYTVLTRESAADSSPWKTNRAFAPSPTNRVIRFNDPVPDGKRFYRLAIP
jgi:hypothetical protein